MSKPSRKNGDQVSASREAPPPPAATAAANEAAPVEGTQPPVCRSSSTPVGHNGQPAATLEAEVGTRWGEIMYPSAARQQHHLNHARASPQQGEHATDAAGATGTPLGDAHAISSGPLQVAVGEDVELQELAGVVRQRVSHTHPQPSSRTMAVLGRHDAMTSPTQTGHGTPLGGRPGSGTRHQNNPYSTVSPVKVVTPVSSNTSPPQTMVLPSYGNDSTGGGGVGPHGGGRCKGVAPPPHHAVHGGAGFRGASDFTNRYSDPGAPMVPAGPVSGMPLPNFQPPPPLFPSQGMAISGERRPLYSVLPNTEQGRRGNDPAGAWAQDGCMPVSGAAPTGTYSALAGLGSYTYSHGHSVSRDPAAPHSAAHAASSCGHAGGLRTWRVPAPAGSAGSASTGESPPPPQPADTQSAVGSGVGEGRFSSVLYPPLSQAVIADVTRYVETEEAHLCYPLVQLPESVVNRGDTEDRRRRVEQRRKQIQYGRETEGYLHYCAVIPSPGLREFHNPNHPITPRPEYDCSKRTFDKYLNEWRRRLHHWDECDPDNLRPPFKPLGAVTLADLHLAPRPSCSVETTPTLEAPSASTVQRDGAGTRVRFAQTGASTGADMGVGGMVSIAARTFAFGEKNGSPLRPASRDGGAGLSSAGSFRNDPYGTSGRSGVNASPLGRANSGSPGSTLFANTSSSFVLTATVNGRTSTCTPSQGPKVDSTFFSPASSSSRAGSPAVNGNPAATLNSSGVSQYGAANSSGNQFTFLAAGSDNGSSGAARTAGGRVFQRSNSSYNAQGAPTHQPPPPPPPQLGGGGHTAAAYGHGAYREGHGVSGGMGWGPNVNGDISHHATPFHHDRAAGAGGAPHTPHRHHVFDDSHPFDFDAINSPITMASGGGRSTPQQGLYRAQYAMPTPHVPGTGVPPIPSFSTPTSSPQGNGGGRYGNYRGGACHH